MTNLKQGIIRLKTQCEQCHSILGSLGYQQPKYIFNSTESQGARMIQVTVGRESTAEGVVPN
jgi:hypothetical protein